MLRLIWNTSTRIRTFMRVWMPTNILLDALRTRRGLRWGIPAMLLSVGYFAVAYWCTTLIADGGPGWLHLIVLAIGAYLTFNDVITVGTFVAVVWGALIGLAIALVLILRVNPQSFHWTMDVLVPWTLLGGVGLALVVTAVATAMIATRGASADEPVAALRQAD